MHSITILDGGMGRELMRRGESVREPLWSANALYENPNMVLEVHRDFISAGADVITANTYGLKPSALRDSGLTSDRENVYRLAFKLAKEAADSETKRKVKVAASLPPLGATYKSGDVPDDEELCSEYRIMVELCEKYEADIILGETLSTIREGEAILKCSKSLKIPIWISFTVRSDGNLRSGESFLFAAESMFRYGASAVLLNCSPPESILNGLMHLEEHGIAGIYGGYANLFYEISKDYSFAKDGPNRIREDINPERYLSFVEKWIEAGASIVGGCCGVGPEYIKLIGERLHR